MRQGGKEIFKEGTVQRVAWIVAPPEFAMVGCRQIKQQNTDGKNGSRGEAFGGLCHMRMPAKIINAAADAKTIQETQSRAA